MRIISSLRALPTGPVVAVLILGIVFGERLQPVGVLSWLILTILVFYKAAAWMLRYRRTATSQNAMAFGFDVTSGHFGWFLYSRKSHNQDDKTKAKAG